LFVRPVRTGARAYNGRDSVPFAAGGAVVENPGWTTTKVFAKRRPSRCSVARRVLRKPRAASASSVQLPLGLR